MKPTATKWKCPKCGVYFESPLPVTAVRCSCSKRANRDYWMVPQDKTP